MGIRITLKHLENGSAKGTLKFTVGKEGFFESMKNAAEGNTGLLRAIDGASKRKHSLEQGERQTSSIFSFYIKVDGKTEPIELESGGKCFVVSKTWPFGSKAQLATTGGKGYREFSPLHDQLMDSATYGALEGFKESLMGVGRQKKTIAEAGKSLCKLGCGAAVLEGIAFLLDDNHDNDASRAAAIKLAEHLLAYGDHENAKKAIALLASFDGSYVMKKARQTQGKASNYVEVANNSHYEDVPYRNEEAKKMLNDAGARLQEEYKAMDAPKSSVRHPDPNVSDNLFLYGWIGQDRYF